MSIKSFSLDSRKSQIQSEFDKLFPMPAPMSIPVFVEESRPWISEYFDDYVIICDKGEYYKVTYKLNGEKIELSPRTDWKEAVSKSEWIAVKAVSGGDEYILEILGAPFGGPDNGRDRQGERFTSVSNLHTEDYPEIPLVLAHGLDPHTGKPVGKPVYVGKAKYLRTDERGHWWKGILDKTKSVVEGLWKAAKKGRLGASSGSLSHLVRIAKDGTILEWPVAEMTLADLDENVRPINSYAIAAPMMKATYREAGLPFPETGNIRDNSSYAQTAAKRAKQVIAQKQAKQILSNIRRNE
jgi:hypothetical protein